jgi:hypothetical protein
MGHSPDELETRSFLGVGLLRVASARAVRECDKLPTPKGPTI